MGCVICGRTTREEYCPFHKKAHDNLVSAYEGWKKAMGVGWEEYLELVSKNPNTGVWALEVCQHLLSKLR